MPLIREDFDVLVEVFLDVFAGDLFAIFFSDFSATLFDNL